MNANTALTTDGRVMDTEQAIAALKELQAARPLLGTWEAAERATAILDRAHLAPIHLHTYMLDKGHSPRETAHMIAMFGTAVKRRYEKEHGVPPLHRVLIIQNSQQRVNSYIEADRPLIDAAYAEIIALKAAMS